MLDPSKKNIKYTLPQIEFDPATQEMEYNKEIKLVDSQWVRNAFMVSIEEVFSNDTRYRYRTPASVSVFDSSVGGHIAVGMPYAFTRYADIPNKGRIADRADVSTANAEWNLGPGRYWNEAYDENSRSRIAYMTFGVEHFTSAFSFYTNAVSYAESVIAREGRTPAFFNIGEVVGEVGLIYAFPGFYLIAKIASYGLKALMGTSLSKYYTMKPAMHDYWRTVNSMVVNAMVERGILTPVLDIDKKTSYIDATGTRMRISEEDLSDLRELAPHIFTKTGAVNVSGIVGRFQTLIDKEIALESKMIEELSLTDSVRSLEKDIEDLANRPLSAKTSDYAEYLKKVRRISIYKEKQVQNQKQPAPESTSYDPEQAKKIDKETGLPQYIANLSKEFMNDMKEYFTASIHDGMSTAAFYVDYVGSSTMTVSNSTKDIPAKSAVNAIGGSVRDIRFSFSGGNLAGDTVKEVTDAVTDFTMGTISGFSLGLSNVIAALTGGGQIEFPKMWDDSSFTLPTHTFKIRLGGPYGDPISQVFDIDIPLMMLLAAALPRRIGKASYTSPFLASLFVRGVTNIEFGMITSLSVTHGVSDMGHTDNGAPLDCEVTFTVTDFTDVMSASVIRGDQSPFEVSIEDDTLLSKYISSISGRGYHTNKYLSRKALLRASKFFMQLDTKFSPEAMASLAGDTAIGGMLNAISPDRSGISMFDPL